MFLIVYVKKTTKKSPQRLISSRCSPFITAYLFMQPVEDRVFENKKALH